MNTTTMPAAYTAPPAKRLSAWEFWGRNLVLP